MLGKGLFLREEPLATEGHKGGQQDAGIRGWGSREGDETAKSRSGILPLTYGFRLWVRTGRKPQVPPLRYAPVGMTILLEKRGFVPSTDAGGERFAPQTKLSSRPERTRISCHAALDRATCAPFRKERRIKFANATNLDRKSGVA